MLSNIIMYVIVGSLEKTTSFYNFLSQLSDGHSELKLLLYSVVICLVIHKVYSDGNYTLFSF